MAAFGDTFGDTRHKKHAMKKGETNG